MPNDDNHSDDNEVDFGVNEEEENFQDPFEGFIDPILALSLIDDDSDLDEEHVNDSMTKRDYKALSRKMNMLVRHTEVFSTSMFEHLLHIHESSVKYLLSESKRVFEEHRMLVKTTNEKLEATLKEMKE